MDCSLPGSLVHEIFQARVLELELAIKSRFVLLQSFSSVCSARRSKQCARKMAKNQAARWLPEVQGGKHKTLVTGGSKFMDILRFCSLRKILLTEAITVLTPILGRVARTHVKKIYLSAREEVVHDCK